MKKKSILVISIFVGLIAVYVVFNTFLKTAPSMKSLKPAFALNAVDLYAEFDANEDSANLKYQNQIVEITGEVVEISEATEGNPVIGLKTEGFGLIKCTLESMPSEEDLKNIKQNSTITVRGECIGMLLDVLIGRTIIIQPKR